MNNFKPKEIMQGFAKLALHMQVGNYIGECAVIGSWQAGESITVQDFIKDMGYGGGNKIYEIQRELREEFASEINHFSDSKNIEKERLFTFNSNMSLLFGDAPKESENLDENCLLPFCNGLRAYIGEIYKLYQAIIKTEVKYSVFDLIVPYTLLQQSITYKRTGKLLADIYIKGLRKGKCVQKYLTDVSFMPPAVENLLRKKGNKYYLENNDVNSVDYKFALLSVFPFECTKNAALFALKAKAWRAAQEGNMR